MYYGFERMWTLSFLPTGFLVVIVGGLAFVGVYAVGATRGGRAALSYARACTWTVLAAIAATAVFGIVDGQWTLFMQWFGPTPMIEMALLAFMWLASMWLMAMSYSRGRMRQEQGGRDTDVGAAGREVEPPGGSEG